MPPKRAKLRLTRMDAACDHLGRMGFAKKEVRSTVNFLLKEVYLGVDAWPFLEEDSYRVVMEAMLEKQDTEHGEPPELDFLPHEEPIRALEACQSVDETHCIGETSTSHENLVGGEDAKKFKALDISEFSSSIIEAGEQGNNVHSPLDTDCARDAEEQEGNDGESCFFVATGHSTRRRPPGYGWISEDDDETIHTFPLTTCKQQAMVQCSPSRHHDRKRRSRWDVEPNNKK